MDIHKEMAATVTKTLVLLVLTVGTWCLGGAWWTNGWLGPLHWLGGLLELGGVIGTIGAMGMIWWSLRFGGRNISAYSDGHEGVDE